MSERNVEQMRTCVGCNAEFESANPSAELCDFCNGFCQTCQTPIGHGQCPGCCAAACVDESFDDRDCCHYCGKEFEEFGDLGCAACDQRVFNDDFEP